MKKEKRLKKQSRNNTPPILLFLTFCLENYKNHKKIDAGEALSLFNKYDVLEYLENVYDTLHTQSKEYIIAEIDEYKKKRKK